MGKEHTDSLFPLIAKERVVDNDETRKPETTRNIESTDRLTASSMETKDPIMRSRKEEAVNDSVLGRS
jgi:hypothetical protein